MSSIKVFSFIPFEFEGKKYVTTVDAYGSDHILLPDKRIVYIKHWYESIPPKPAEIKVFTQLEGTSTVLQNFAKENNIPISIDLDMAIELAVLIHGKLCQKDPDVCSFEWSHNWEENSHQYYLNKAVNVLLCVDGDLTTIRRVINAL